MLATIRLHNEQFDLAQVQQNTMMHSTGLISEQYTAKKWRGTSKQWWGSRAARRGVQHGKRATH